MFCLTGCIERTGMVKDDHSLCVLPLFHIFSQFTNMMMPIYLGASITILPQFIPGVVVKEIQSKKITFFCAVPGMYSAILALLAQNPQADLSSLRICISGGSSLPIEIYNQFLDVCKVDLIEGSGPTEAVTFVGVPGSDKPGSVGLPLKGVEVKIVDESDQELPQGEIGEICVKGPNVMKEYQNLPEATAEAMKGGWFHTGDLGRIDEDGFVYIVDRKKDMIIVGGMNVYPREIEECLYQHPKIYEAAVIGISDKDRGQVPCAYVVLKPGMEADPKELILHCRSNLANFKCPRDVVIVESLPKNPTGKIDKKLIR
jgi:long-chain acyl-CoA synthetase